MALVAGQAEPTTNPKGWSVILDARHERIVAVASVGLE